MAQQDIDFEELDKAISALMDGQSDDAVLDDLADEQQSIAQDNSLASASANDFEADKVPEVDLEVSDADLADLSKDKTSKPLPSIDRDFKTSLGAPLGIEQVAEEAADLVAQIKARSLEDQKTSVDPEKKTEIKTETVDSASPKKIVFFKNEQNELDMAPAEADDEKKPEPEVSEKVSAEPVVQKDQPLIIKKTSAPIRPTTPKSSVFEPVAKSPNFEARFDAKKDDKIAPDPEKSSLFQKPENMIKQSLESVTTEAKTPKVTEVEPKFTPEPEKALETNPEETPSEAVAVSIESKPKAVAPKRRGRFIDMVTATPSLTSVGDPRHLAQKMRAQRLAKAQQINQAQTATLDDFKAPETSAKAMPANHSVDFSIKLPASDGESATTVTGNYQTSETLSETDDGDTVVIKRRTMEYVAVPTPEETPEPELEGLDAKELEEAIKTAPASEEEPVQKEIKPETKPSKTEASEKAPETIESADDFELELEDELTAQIASVKAVTTDKKDDDKPKSPFISEAKVKKRPLGQPEPLLQQPAVTMHVPERISTYDSGNQTALYRAELHSVSEPKKASKFWTFVLILIIAVVAFLAFYFWPDLKIMFL